MEGLLRIMNGKEGVKVPLDGPLYCEIFTLHSITGRPVLMLACVSFYCVSRMMFHCTLQSRKH
jgi:hypothetical protein